MRMLQKLKRILFISKFLSLSNMKHSHFISIYRLARFYTETKSFDELILLLKNNNSFFSIIPKAKTAKIVRNILDIIEKIPNSLNIQVTLCKDVISWCKIEKRTFLRQRIEAKVCILLCFHAFKV